MNNPGPNILYIWWYRKRLIPRFYTTPEPTLSSLRLTLQGENSKFSFRNAEGGALRDAIIVFFADNNVLREAHSRYCKSLGIGDAVASSKEFILMHTRNRRVMMRDPGCVSLLGMCMGLRHASAEHVL